MAGRNTIRTRLYFTFGVMLSLVVFLFVAILLSVWRGQETKNTAQRALDMAGTLDRLRSQVMQNRLLLGDYVVSGTEDDLNRLNSEYQKFGTLLQDARNRVNSDGERGALADLERNEKSWYESMVRPMIQDWKEINAGSKLTSGHLVRKVQWRDDSDNYLERAARENRAVLERSRKSDEDSLRLTGWIAFFVMLVAVGIGAYVAWHTARAILLPLDSLNRMARDIGESGDLDHTVEVARDDEIGDLAKTFNSMVLYLKEMASVSEAIAGGDLSIEVEPRSNRDTLAKAFAGMTEGLRNLARSVRDSAAQVAAGSSQVADASDESAKISVQTSSAIDEVTSTMHEMSVNVQNMVRNTQMQSSSVSETSASIDQMVASIQRVADTAKVLLDISNRSREEVQSGIDTMQKATDGLGRINRSIKSSAEIIGSLGLRADDIGKIIEVIDDLAEQTNLLALNAAIEAARAGEHGLGFAVVADEVRKLAEKSAQSTKEISELIQNIQKEARKAVENMERSTSIVNEGLELGNEMSGALKKISAVVTEVYKFAQEIGAATNEQSHGSAQIARATTRLNEITHEINSSVEEQASGAQAVVRAMERMRELTQQSTSGSTELAASSEQMSKMARQLLEAMDRFVIDTISSVGRNGSNGHDGNLERSSGAKYAAVAR